MTAFFSFVVEGHTDSENPQEIVGGFVDSMLSSAGSSGTFVRVGSFNPPDWAPRVQSTDQASDPHNAGNTGTGAMGTPETPKGPEGEQTASST